MSENDTKSHINHIHNNNNSNSNDRIEWSRSTILGFIEDYRRQRVLWDPNTKGYHIKQTKYEALKALGQKYCTEIRSIRSKIKSLRSSFHREHGKVMNGRRKGIHYQPMWFAYEAIRFILVGDGNNSNNHIDTKNIINNNNNSIENTETTITTAKALTNFVVDSTISPNNHDQRKQHQQNGGSCNGISNSNTIGIKDDIEDDFDGDGDGGDIDGDDDGNEGEGGDDDDDDTDTEEMKLFISTNTNMSNNQNSTATATSSSTASTPTLSQHFNSTNGRNSFTFKTEIDNRAETPNISTDKKSPSLASYHAIDNHHLIANTLNCLQKAATIELDGLDYATKMAYFFSKGINNCNLPNPLLALTTKVENNNNNSNNYNFNNINKNNYKINKTNNNNHNNGMALSNGLLGAAGTAFTPSSVHHQQFGLTGVATNGSGSVSDNVNSSGAVTVDDGSMARVAAVIAAAKAAAKANNNANVCSLPQSADVIGNAASNSDLDGELQTYCNIRAEDVKTEIIESDTGDLNLSIPDKQRRETPSPNTLYYHNIRNNQSTNNNNNNRPTDLSANSSRKRKALASRYERYNCNGLNDEAPSPSKQSQQQPLNVVQHPSNFQQQHPQQQQQHSKHLHLKPQITITTAAGRELLTNTTSATSLVPTTLNRQTSSVTLSSTKTNSNNNNISSSNSNINNNNSSSSSSSSSTSTNNTNKLLCLNQSKEQQQGVPLPLPLQQQTQVPQQQIDEYGIFGEYVAVTIRKLKTSKAKIVVKHLINNLLYEAELGKYDHGIPSSKEPPQLYKM